MIIRRFNPFWEMENLIRKSANLIDSTIGNNVKIKSDFSPRVDVWQDETSYHFDFELPGVRKEDIKLTVNKDKVLILNGEKKFDSNTENKTCCRSERVYGHFHRAFQLPDDINVNKVSANFENGVLKVSVSKSEVKQQREKLVEVQ